MSDDNLAEIRDERAKKVQHPKGKLTAYERIGLILDVDSFSEIDENVSSDANPDGEAVITGSGTIHGRPVYIYSEDFSIMGGSLGEVVAKKIMRVMDLALEARAPIIGIKDSGGARIQEGISSLYGYAQIFKKNVQASGKIPQISVIVGPSAGGAVYSPALTDFIFQVKDIGQLYVTGPAVVKTVTGEDVSFEELGGIEAHGTLSGVSHQICEDEQQAFDEVRYLLSFLPQSSEQKPPVFITEDDTEKTVDILDGFIPENRNQPYDMNDIINNIVDDGEQYPIHANYALNIITTLARVNGNTIGIIGNQPLEVAGVLDINASEKAARFVRFCDAFNIPLLTLVDVPGFLPGVEQEHGGIIRSGAKLLYAYSEATVARVCVVVRKAYGGAYIVMDSMGLGADKLFAWPSAEIAVMGAEGAVDIIHKKEIKEADNKDALKAKLVEEYNDKFSNPDIAAKLGLVDKIIKPSETRKVVTEAFKELVNKTNLGDKHGNIPL
ncbi:acyl-CoA carboxylase subunit beta [Acidimicrobiaceae bacterium]|jgi:acetyl-CoA carboxylase carboxyltransferase component|nr:acyl-CoA carboxylase subunit beta [Acidimicrobiaceae bacterium]MDA8964382.1 acyl-CoA carboxylase subunit beta [Acidimicrobiia bacterium]MDA9209541.1 acyl-CoA carboxylase subunit beta [Acidimicrobiia bacterium]MDA9275565.1 acyl-CoA carboxylase subunit beta [Acidimicrobiia bacterium]MDC3374199.1 acyl-CoA carboxylase subunit beta [Acidimicrobiia bacterium]|tara:strand:+ start:39 stop:1526 length:1488 start_codon:yes stop_codon:yes gene_type:complete